MLRNYSNYEIFIEVNVTCIALEQKTEERKNMDTSIAKDYIEFQGCYTYN